MRSKKPISFDIDVLKFNDIFKAYFPQSTELRNLEAKIAHKFFETPIRGLIVFTSDEFQLQIGLYCNLSCL